MLSLNFSGLIRLLTLLSMLLSLNFSGLKVDLVVVLVVLLLFMTLSCFEAFVVMFMSVVVHHVAAYCC